MEIHRVDFPGYVKNTDKAINMLGGNYSIYSSLKSEEPEIQVNFRNNDDMAHRIVSQASADPSLLLRIRIRKRYSVTNGQRKLDSIDYIPEVVGLSKRTISFSQPSDFQFLPPLSFSYSESTVQDPPPQSFLYLPPPVFLHNTRYGATYIQRRIFASQQNEKMKVWTKYDCPWIINQKVLLSLENGPSRPKNAIDVDFDLKSKFEDLFCERPIWTALALFDYFASNGISIGGVLQMSEQSPIFFHTLATVAYYIKNGPYKLCWVKYGYNPLNHPKFSLYQAVVLSLKSWEHAPTILKKVPKTSSGYSSKSIENIPKGISKLSVLPNRLFYALQIFDLNDVFIRHITQFPLEKYDFQSGWYSDKTISVIRQFCILKLQRMLDPSLSNQDSSILMADIVTEFDLKKSLEKEKSSVSDNSEYDFVFLNQAQSILNVFDESPSIETEDIKLILSKKFSAISVPDRLLTY